MDELRSKPAPILRASGSLRLLGLVLTALILPLILSGAAQAETVKRRILAIYDSAFEASPDATRVHAWAEMPLNHLGYVIDYRDAAQGLPDPRTTAQYSAVLTWFTYDLTNPVDYLIWARNMANNKIPFIVLGHIGVPATPQYLASANLILRPMGIALTSNFIEASNGTRIVRSDPSIVGFERRLENILPSYPVVQQVSAQAAIAFEVEAPARERKVRSALVTAGRSGAFIPGDFALALDPALGRSQWLVNPFAVFERVLNTGPRPIPDTTTVSGRRLYFSQVDGDGWNDSVEMERYNNSSLSAASVVERELIAPYPDLPVTVGLISSDLKFAYDDGKKATEAARRIFALPQVEVATHTATAPQVWTESEFQSGSEEEDEAAGAPMPASGGEPWFYVVTDALGITKTRTDKWQLASRPLSGRGKSGRFSLYSEILGSARAASKLSPAGKRAAIVTWTGDAKPFESAILTARRAGMRNLNGGGGRLDSDYPSITYITPLGRQVGGERQIYSVNAGDNSYVVGRNGSLGGFGRLTETWDATEKPRRLRGVHLHYHVYSAKKQALLNAVKRHLDWARAERLAYIKASDYASIAEGFFSAGIEKTGPMTWRIASRDGLQTVRFDSPGPLVIDTNASLGVVGSTLYGGSLYVALDAAVKEAVITLKNLENKSASASGAAQLEQSNWQLHNLRQADCGFGFTAHGFGPGQFEWKNLARGAYRVVAKRSGGPIWQGSALVDRTGRLNLEIPADGSEPLAVRVECSPGTEARPL